MTGILKRKGFARWQAGEKLPDAALCKAVKEMKRGLIDADFGRLPLQEAGGAPRRRQEWRLPHAAVSPDGSRYVFLHGFPKNDKANITQDEKKALQYAGKVFLELSAEALSKALQSGVLVEVHCEQDH